MDAIRVNEVINQIYSEHGVPEGFMIDDMNKKDFERFCYYRGLNRVAPEQKKKLEMFQTILMHDCHLGVAAASMVLFRLGVFLSEMGVDHR